MSTKRSLRIAGLIKKDISDIIREDVRDPDIGMLTITKVIVSPDLKNAKIYMSVIGDQVSREKTFLALKRAKGFIRTALGQRGSFRYTPELRFYYDDTLDYVDSIETLIKKAHKKDDLRNE